MAKRFLRRVWLFVRIVWRIDQSESRMAASTAWEVANIMHPKVESWEAGNGN